MTNVNTLYVTHDRKFTGPYYFDSGFIVLPDTEESLSPKEHLPELERGNPLRPYASIKGNDLGLRRAVGLRSLHFADITKQKEGVGTSKHKDPAGG